MTFQTAVKAAFSTTAALSVLLAPSAGLASAAPAPSQGTAEVTASGFDAKCRSHSRTYVLKKYYRGPRAITLRCGTPTWGWKHIKARHGWSSTMDKKINAAIWSGDDNGRGGYSTYLNQCPRVEKFRTIIGTPAGNNDLLTAYKVDQPAIAGTAAC
ncbi:hypothetical protein [Streptomyces sp. NPDC050145]|uniref:hypothetical protein n=1 Tax=Streptomyces sp. NPDC050145 TaxID=3365602 RepID=UPI0037A86988